MNKGLLIIVITISLFYNFYVFILPSDLFSTTLDRLSKTQIKMSPVDDFLSDSSNITNEESLDNDDFEDDVNITSSESLINDSSSFIDQYSSFISEESPYESNSNYPDFDSDISIISNSLTSENSFPSSSFSSSPDPFPESDLYQSSTLDSFPESDLYLSSTLDSFWKSTSPNIDSYLSEFSSSYPFESDSFLAPESSEIEDPVSIPTATCQFPDFNFTEKEIRDIWQYQSYSSCKTKSQDEIEIIDNKFVAKCASNLPAKYFGDPGRPEKLGGSTKIFASWSSFSPDLSKPLFAFVKCQEGSTYAYTFLRFNKTSSDRASNITSSIMKSFNISTKINKNLKVLLLVFDSISRGSAYRNLPKTIEFLRSLKKENFFEFTNPAVPELHTQDNMAQILYGETKKKMQKTLGVRNPSMVIPSRLHVTYQSKAIWSYFRDQGFVTLFIHDTVWDFLSYLTGHDIYTDHFLGNFWKAAWAVYGFHDYDNRQKCMGQQNSHNMSLGHAYKFFETYPNNHQFGYLHLNSAHEKTGNVKTIDLDLRDFFNYTLQLFRQRNDDFALFLIGDHGSNVDKIQFDRRGIYEYRQPMSFLVTSDGLVDKEKEKILRHNEKQLFSRFDLHFTLRDLANMPYGGMKDDRYRTERTGFEVSDVVSLFREKISENRTCKDVGVPKEYCPCNDYERIEPKNSVETLIRGYTINVIQEFLNNRKKSNKECTITLFNVTDYQKLFINNREDGWETLYKVQVQSNTMTGHFDVRSCTEKRIKETKTILDMKYFTTKNFTIESISVFFQVSKIKILGSCAEDCFC